MASAVVLNEVLQASPEKDNFMRLSRLVNGAGAKIVKGLFDSKIPPKDLAAKLSDPQVYTLLQGLKKRKVLTSSEWDKLFPPTVVESKSFDLTLLVKLLTERGICGLRSPMNGWNNLPSKTDTTLEADIARLRWYRNTFAHPNKMEIEQDDFSDQWDDIKGALLRILGSYSDSSNLAKCKKKIEDFRTASLSHDDLERVMENLGCSELLILCTTKFVSTGAEWLKGGAYILGNGINDILEYFDLKEGVEVVDVTDGSVKIVLWVTHSIALERLWEIYKSGKLTEDLERILLTDELRQLAKGEKLKLEVVVSEEDYKRAQEQLRAKEEDEKEGEKLAEKFEAKMRIKPKASQFEIFDGDIVEDGENKWQAYLAVITSKDQVEKVLTELKKKDPDVAKATHNIWAYRFFNAERDAYDENCDDDGDDTSGARVLRFLQRTRATDVMVVVSCWYETTAEDFGEIRFKCIKKSVLDLLLTYRIVEIPHSIIKKIYEEIKYTPFERAKEQETPKFDILHGETIEDRKSTFQAHLADITSRKQVEQVLDELKKDRKIANAKYNMWACRIYGEKKKYFIEESNDDGENLGGERLLHLLQRCDAKNVVIIVTRWHGGIHLGNDRFKHINKCASDLLQQRRMAEMSTGVVSTDVATRKKKTKERRS